MFVKFDAMLLELKLDGSNCELRFIRVPLNI